MNIVEDNYNINNTETDINQSKIIEHLKSIGVEKVQLSLDSFIEEDHDAFRNKKFSYQKVMRAVDAALNADLNLILSTVLIKGRAKEKEFEGDKPQRYNKKDDVSLGLRVP